MINYVKADLYGVYNGTESYEDFLVRTKKTGRYTTDELNDCYKDQ